LSAAGLVLEFAAAVEEFGIAVEFVAPASVTLEVVQALVPVFVRPHAQQPAIQANAKIRTPIRMLRCYS
jgi:hypothetical protein